MADDTTASTEDKKPGMFSRIGGFFGRHKGKGKAVATGAASAAGWTADKVMYGGYGVARGIMSLRGNFTSILLILVAALHFWNVTQGVSTLFSAQSNVILGGFILLGLLGGLVVYRGDTSDMTELMLNTLKFVLLSVATYALPVLLVTLSDKGYIPYELAKLFMICTPLFVIYIFLNPGDWLTRFLAGAYFIVITFYIITSVILPLMGDNLPSTTARVGTPAEVMDMLRKVIGATVKTGTDLGQSIYTVGKGTVTGNLNNSVPELFVGQVDKNQGPPLGVFHTNGRAIQEKFRVDIGDAITTTSEVRSRTLSEQESEMTHTCRFQTQDYSSMRTVKLSTADGVVSPEKTILTYSGVQQDVFSLQCDVPNDALSAIGYKSTVVTGDVIMNTTFPFSTSGYVTYAFMDRILYEKYRGENRDPAKEMGLPIARQLAKYTPGPVSIGMPGETLPIPYDAAAEKVQIPPLGLTFSSTQTGRGGIQSFTSVRVFVPKQFELGPSEKCAPTGVQVSPIEPSSMGDTYREYEVTNVMQKDRVYGTQITIRCPMTIASAERGNILQSTGFSLYTVLVQANYTFAVDSRIPVTLTVKAQPSSSLLIGGSPNLDVAPDRFKCKTVGPVCEKPGEASYCACYIEPVSVTTAATAKLSYCRWTRPNSNQLENYNRAQCSDTLIPAQCDAATRCTIDGECQCGLFIQSEQRVYYWHGTEPASCRYMKCTADETGTYACAEKDGEAHPCE